jgi:hypothetical protein
MIIALEVSGFPETQDALEVMMQETVSLSERLLLENVALFVPAVVLPIFH